MSRKSFRNDVLPLKDILFRLALRITKGRETAEDVVQETLIKVWNKRDDWQNIDSMEAFCLTICRNIAVDHIRKKGADSLPYDESEEAMGEDYDPDPYEKTSQNDRIAWIRRLVDELPEKQRSCIQLRDFEEKSYKDIAAIMNISEESVKVNIFRARQTIKQRIQETDDYGL